MAQYSIKDLETLSGIKAHTIRIWEKRYELLHPERTDTNIRFYSDDDLKMLLNVALLNKKGIKISRIADMSVGEICTKVEDFTDQDYDSNAMIDRLIVEMIDMREDRLTALLDKVISDKGLMDAFGDVVYPFLERIGVLWQIGSITPSQEHFVSHLLRNKLIAEIVGLDNNWDSKTRFVLFLPKDELHEIGLLLYYYILKKQGAYVMYLGQNVPYSDIGQVIRRSRATHTLSVFINAIPQEELNYIISSLSTDFPDITHYVTGYQAITKLNNKHKNITLIQSVDQFPF